MHSIAREIRRFGPFELDLDAGEVRRDGRRVKLQPQPFRLLVLLTARPGSAIRMHLALDEEALVVLEVGCVQSGSLFFTPTTANSGSEYSSRRAKRRRTPTR